MAKIDVSVETNDQPTPQPTDPNTCPSCHSHYRDDELEQSLWVCEQCGHHFPMRARARIASLTDPGSFTEEATELHSEDPLGFFDLRPYTERIAQAEMETGLADAMVIGRGTMDGRHCELAVMEYHGRNRAPKVIRSPMRPRASPAPPFPLRNPPTISPPFLDSLVIPTIFQTPRIAA